jgi:hypothetical protein
MESNTVAALAARVAELERSQRRTRIFAAVGIAAALAVGGVLRRADAASKTVEAESFVLKDDKGKQRAVLFCAGADVQFFLGEDKGANLLITPRGIECKEGQHKMLFACEAPPEKEPYLSVGTPQHEMAMLTPASLTVTDAKQQKHTFP